MDGRQGAAGRGGAVALILRPAVAGDRQAIVAIHAASWLDSYRPYLSADYLATTDDRLGAHWAGLALGEHDLLLLAEADGEPTGFLLAWDGEPFWINTLHTMPGRRSRGVGTRLMVAAAAHFRDQGRTAAWLDVIESNHRAIAFYRRLGGVPGTVKSKLVGDRMVPNLRIDFPDLRVIFEAG